MLLEVQYFYILISFSISLLIHYLIIELTHRKGIFLDEHDKVQKMHHNPTPRIGGLGIFLSSMFILNDNNVGGYLILAGIPAFIAGFLEDYSGKVSPEQRLAIMCLSPVMAFIMIPFSIYTHWSLIEVPALVGMFASLVFIVALVNGVNFTDGQNGLASGTVFFSFLTLSVIAYLLGDKNLFFISLIILAAIFAFLIYNFPKGKIFLGDSGAYFLGFMLPTTAIVIVHKHLDQLSPLIIPAVLIYPLWEVVFSTIRKLFYDKISPLKSDDYHLHQLLYRNKAKGKGYIPTLLILPAQAVMCMLIVTFRNETSILFISILVYIVLYTVVYFIERKIDVMRSQSRSIVWNK